MLHHVSIGSNDISRSRALYDSVMTVLGMRVLAEDQTSVDYGATDIIFSVETPLDGRPATAGNGAHVAFQARDRATVQAFHRVGLENGASDDGAPGLRPEYDAHYSGAFLRDPDGNKIEAVTFSAD